MLMNLCLFNARMQTESKAEVALDRGQNEAVFLEASGFWGT